MKLTVPYMLIVLGLLAGCAAPSEPMTLSCNDSQMLCYRGNTIDRGATLEHYGVQGQYAIHENQFGGF